MTLRELFEKLERIKELLAKTNRTPEEDWELSHLQSKELVDVSYDED